MIILKKLKSIEYYSWLSIYQFTVHNRELKVFKKQILEKIIDQIISILEQLANRKDSNKIVNI